MARMNNIMLDMETLGTRADSVILSIGACRFDLYSDTIDDAGFYASISIDSNHEAVPRHIGEDTLIWWMQQSNLAQAVFTEAKTTLYSALVDFVEWCGDSNDLKVWSNGADFDIPMIAHALTTNDLTIPWHFWNTGCFRTLKNMPKAKAVPKPASPVAHHALHDAVAQARHLQAIWKAIA